MKHLLAATAFAVLTTAARAQGAAPLPAVETMTCDQMIAEMSVAGAQMNAQLDPQFAVEAQAMNEQMQNARNGNSSRPDPRTTAAQAEANRNRHAAQAGRINDAMAGLDQQRLMAMAERFESERCPTPQ
jgi:hypothetical protein